MFPNNLIETAITKPKLFEEELWAWFWKQFDNLGGCGTFVTDMRIDIDDRTIIEESLAKMVFEAFPCAPFQIRLFEKHQLNYDTVGLVIETFSHTIRVGTEPGTTWAHVDYTWPELYTEVSEHGISSGGTHKTKRHSFDLASSESLDMIRECVMRLCHTLLEKAKPQPSLASETKFTLFPAELDNM